MASLTRDQIITRALTQVGRDEDAYVTLAQQWLQQWLDSVAKSWEWPQLRDEWFGFELDGSATAPAGYQFGKDDGVDSPSQLVTAIEDNIWLYLLDGSAKRRLRVERTLRDPIGRLPLTNKPSGTPTSVAVIKSDVEGVWDIFPNCPVDRTYLLMVPYRYIPTALASGSTIPWFPDDTTLIAAVVYAAQRHANGAAHEETIAAQEALATMLSQAKVRNVPTDSLVEMSNAFPNWRR